MAYPNRSNKSFTAKGVHDNFEYMRVLREAIDNIRELSLYKLAAPEKYFSAVQYLYSLWLPKAFKDPYFQDEIMLYEKEFDSVYKKKARTPKEREQLEELQKKIMPVKMADFVFKAIMKSMDRMDILPREKRAINI